MITTKGRTDIIKKGVGNHIVKAAFAAALAAAVSATSVPSVLYAHQIGTEDNAAAAESGTSKTAGSGAFHAAESGSLQTAEGTSREQTYEKGQVLVLYDRLAGSSSEALVGSSGAAETYSVLSAATVIDTVSEES